MRQDVSPLSVIIAMAAMLAVAAPGLAQQAKGQQQQQQQQQQQKQRQQQGATASQPVKVDLDDLEKNPTKYLGKMVMVEGEVDRVLGPHLFSVHERKWLDLGRQLPVAVPEPFTAIVTSDAPVRVTGVVEKLPVATVQEVGGLIREPRIRAEITSQPRLVATEGTTVEP